ncbi:ABC transporter permease [Sinorhizobium meliloti]|uniref:ABC transporter permease n=1 Tax=Rhizobium meliloti TaxID=382 RepID=UPI0009B67965|nr:ABC transporter permease [Sinorhizobium meliloti]MDE3761440.1 ABC transporter permease [Sinorhizobium meliloti]
MATMARQVPKMGVTLASDRVIYPLIVLLLFFAAWQYGTGLFGIPNYLLPTPSDFLGKFVSDWAALSYHFASTAYVVLLGFLIATSISIPLGLAIASYPSLRRNAMPLFVFFEIIPKTITAPLLIVWFGFGFSPRIALTAVMTFFPILVNSIAGFSSINPRLGLITRSMGATPWQTFRLMRVPAALPHIFSGMKIGMVYAVAGCMTAEFVGANEGLAYLILSASSFMDTALMFAGIVATALLGMLLTGALLALEKWMMPWRNERS